jgi:hypothetical protein
VEGGVGIRLPSVHDSISNRDVPVCYCRTDHMIRRQRCVCLTASPDCTICIRPGKYHQFKNIYHIRMTVPAPNGVAADVFGTGTVRRWLPPQSGRCLYTVPIPLVSYFPTSSPRKFQDTRTELYFHGSSCTSIYTENHTSA